MSNNWFIRLERAPRSQRQVRNKVPLAILMVTTAFFSGCDGKPSPQYSHWQLSKNKSISGIVEMNDTAVNPRDVFTIRRQGSIHVSLPDNLELVLPAEEVRLSIDDDPRNIKEIVIRSERMSRDDAETAVLSVCRDVGIEWPYDRNWGDQGNILERSNNGGEVVAYSVRVMRNSVGAGEGWNVEVEIYWKSRMTE